MQALEVVHWGQHACKRKRESPVASVEDPGHPDSLSRLRTMSHQDGQEGDSEDGLTSSCPQAAGTSRHREQRWGIRDRAGSGVTHPHKRQTPQKEVFTSSEDGELANSEEDTEPSASDQGRHDDCQPKRRASASDFGTSIWTTQEWKILLASGDYSDLDDTSKEDSKLRTHTKPSKCKTKWSASQAHSQIKSSLRMLRGRKKAAPFRALRLPDTINWPELMKGKAFEDSELRVNAAGTCCLSALVRRRPMLMAATSIPCASLSCPWPMPPRRS
jgi:hypothetical protein